MRCIRRYVSEEWFLLLHTFANKFMTEFKKHIRTKTLGLNNFSIVEISAVKISVVPYIRCLPHSTASVTIHLGKSTILRTIRIIIAHMPLSKHSRLVSILFKELTQCTLIFPQHGATHNGMPHTSPVCPVTGHQGRPRRRTGGSYMIICKPERFIG